MQPIQQSSMMLIPMAFLFVLHYCLSFFVGVSSKDVMTILDLQISAPLGYLFVLFFGAILQGALDLPPRFKMYSFWMCVFLLPLTLMMSIKYISEVFASSYRYQCSSDDICNAMHFDAVVMALMWGASLHMIYCGTEVLTRDAAQENRPIVGIYTPVSSTVRGIVLVAAIGWFIFSLAQFQLLSSSPLAVCTVGMAFFAFAFALVMTVGMDVATVGVVRAALALALAALLIPTIYIFRTKDVCDGSDCDAVLASSYSLVFVLVSIAGLLLHSFSAPSQLPAHQPLLQPAQAGYPPQPMYYQPYQGQPPQQPYPQPQSQPQYPIRPSAPLVVESIQTQA